jgi:predicted transcriptional regulator
LLKDILRMIKNEKYISKSKIAKELNTTEAVIEQAFSQLYNMGYIKIQNSTDCSSHKCSGCSFAAFCNKMPLNTIIITEKGEKILNN